MWERAKSTNIARLGHRLKHLAIAFCTISVLSGCAAPLMIAAGTTAGVFAQAPIGDSISRHAASKQQRQRATAAALGPQVDWFAVKVSGATRRGTMIFWTAKTPLGRYACSEQPGDTVAGCTKLADGPG